MCWFIDLESLKRVFSHLLLFFAATDGSDDLSVSRRRGRSKRLAHCQVCDKYLCDTTELYRHANHFHKVGNQSFLKVATTRPVDFLFHEPSFSCLTFKANVLSSINAWIDIVYPNRKRIGRFWCRYYGEKSLLALSFESVTFRPRSSFICTWTFLTRSVHFHGPIIFYLFLLEMFLIRSAF